jgi:hypothetical protein
MSNLPKKPKAGENVRYLEQKGLKMTRRTKWEPEQISTVDPQAKLEAHMRLKEAEKKFLKTIPRNFSCKAPQSTKT